MSQIRIPIPSSSIIGVSSAPLQTPSVNILRVEPAITGLTGSTVNDLDSIVTATGNYAVGICIFLVINGTPAIYQLVAGTATENPPSIILPDDYNAVDNAKYWIQRM
jgi:hypothetical protein